MQHIVLIIFALAIVGKASSELKSVFFCSSLSHLRFRFSMCFSSSLAADNSLRSPTEALDEQGEYESQRISLDVNVTLEAVRLNELMSKSVRVNPEKKEKKKKTEKNEKNNNSKCES